MRRTTASAVASLAVVALAATGCQGAGTDGASGVARSAAPTSAAPSSATPAPSTGGTGAGKPVAVHETITDPVMGDKVLVRQVVRDFPVPASMSAVADREIVLVQVRATAGSKYYAGWQATSLSVVANGEENPETSTDALIAAMKRAGYPPMADDGDLDTGKSGGGWLAFVVDPEDVPRLTLRMKRPAATTSDGGSISAHDFDVPLAR
ncbi:hypothetical protein Athai_18510 [Actinocatenispora thailandica]|uniref:DUF4352 domain-containing protein n=1 Tax=Actinocatenispora thailandica TaxID=227318 RepID=A0A7R7DMI3_9ACTN|nr:hypothetical protein [Actinocatenispora thailandica]BCJ34348.1 hypothetical protein Athai_18510 [Actinocatenispora thailandica]